MIDYAADLLGPEVAKQPTETDYASELLGTPIAGQSYTTLPKLTAADTAAEIVRQQDAGGFPQGSRKDRGFFESMGDMVTGNDRQTNATRNLPELGTEIGLGEFLGMDTRVGLGDVRGLPVSAAALTTTDPVEMVKILQEKAGDRLSVRPDEAGNIIVGLDGREAVLNKPGFTPFDAMQLGGFMAAFTPASKAATAPTILGNMARVGGASAATQAGIEALQSSQGGEFNPGDVALTGVTAGAFQGAFQKLAQSIPFLRQKIQQSGITDDIRRIYQQTAVKLGMSADDVTDDVIRNSVAGTTQAITPEQGLALSGEREFGIPLTRGQRSLDDAQLSFEDRARVGLKGESAQRVMRGFEDETQVPAINAARERIESTIGGDGSLKPGSVIREGVKTAERTADDLVGDAYESVGKAELTGDGLKGLINSVRRSVMGTEFDQNLPQTRTLLDEVAKQKKIMATFSGKGLRSVDLNRLEQMRRRFNTAIGAADNPSDKRQVTIMKRAFDDYLDGAVQNALFTGDAAALESLKGARGLFSEYAKKFRAQPIRGKSGRIVDRDEPGQFIEKLIDADPTDEQVVNAVFGASGMNKGSGAAMAARFRDILGRDSEGWTAIRRAALGRIIQTNRNGKGIEMVSGAKTLSALDSAMEKNGTLMKELFTQDEINMLKRFAFHVKRTQAAPTISRENPSGTAQVAGKALAETVKQIGAAFALSGNPLVTLTTTGASIIKPITAAGKASAAVRPFSQLQQVKPAIVAGAIAAEQ